MLAETTHWIIAIIFVPLELFLLCKLVSDVIGLIKNKKIDITSEEGEEDLYWGQDNKEIYKMAIVYVVVLALLTYVNIFVSLKIFY